MALRGRSIVAGLLIALVIPATPGSVSAAPPISTGGPYTYVEQASPTKIGTGTIVSGDNFYDGKYVDFEITGSGTTEHLGLEPSTTASVAAGVVSVVGSAVYIGDGTTAVPIGSVDATFDGAEGRKLRVKFGSDFRNAGFETGDMTPWTAMNQFVELGVTPIAGFVAEDTATYPINAGGDGDVPASGTYSTAITSADPPGPTEGTYALGLTSNMTTANTCDVVHGPAAYSAAFDSVAGQTLTFDWRAYAGSDAYAVFGYLLDTATGAQTEVLDTVTSDMGGTTDWATVDVTVPSNGTYRFVFVSGTFDASCGRAAGASLYVDNFQVVSASFVDDAIVSKVAEKLTYENTSDDPAAQRTVAVTAEDSLGETAAGSLIVDITAVNDLPVGTPATEEWENTAADDTFVDLTGTLAFSDPDDASVSYSIAGATSGTYSLGGIDYDTTVDGTFATLFVDAETGAYRLVADDAAIEDVVSDPDSEVFTVTAFDGSDTGSAALTLGILLPPSPRNVTGVPGDGEVTVSWDQPIESNDVVGYTVTATPGGASCSTTDVASTICTVPGLTNSQSYTFVVTTTIGTPSLASSPVTPVGPPTAPRNPTAAPSDGRVLVEWDAPLNDGGSAVTGYTVATSPGDATCTTTGATNCTVLGLAGGTTYTFTVIATTALGASPATAPVSATVKSPSSTGLAANPTSANVGDTVTLTATVAGSDATGSVEFFDGTTSLGTAAVAHSTAVLATTALPAGLRNITAAYSGDADNHASTSAALAFATTGVATASLAVSETTPVVGDSIRLTATISGASPTGTVEFFDGPTSMGSVPVSAGAAALSIDSLTVGDHTIIAVYSGDAYNTDATSTAVTLTVEELVVDQVITFGELADVPIDVTPAALKATADSGLAVQFTAAPAAVCTVKGTTLSLHGQGVCTVTASQPGDATHNPASVERTFDVLPGTEKHALELELVLESGAAVAGAPVDVTGSGLEPNSPVRIELHSDPVLLGTTTTDEVGSFATEVHLPESVPAGRHQVIAFGTAPDGTEVTAVQTFFVDWSGKSGDIEDDAGYVPVTPSRVIDTRESTAVGAGEVLRVTIPEQMIGADATAAVLNVAVTKPADAGFVTVYSCTSERPWSSALNYVADQTISNLVVASYTGSELCVFTSAATHIVVDLDGYYSPSADDLLETITPTRAADTRTTTHVEAGTVLEVPMSALELAPDDASAAVLYVAVDRPASTGFLTVFPCGSPMPLAANLNFVAGETIGNDVIAKIGDDGAVCVYATSDTDITVDVTGWFGPAGVGHYAALVPGRVLDTREAEKVEAGQVVEIEVSGDTGAPAGTPAVSMHIAAVNAEALGFLTVYPCGTERPWIASLNFHAGQTIGSHVVAEIGATGRVCIYSKSTTDLVVDVEGIFV